MIEFPDWYQGGFPDRELVVMDLVQTYLNLCTPAGLACTWLPDNVNALVDAGTPVVRVYRGGLGADGLWDAAAVQLGVIAATRADSWSVMEYLRQIMLSYEHGGPVRREDGSITMLQSVSEIVGPQQLPELNPDHRLVPATFRVECRIPRDVPDYALIRESLPL
ncbi:phage tail termination protein [Nocardia puris]|uniref:phage tail termination protein n=1 Tax=Nocardia puris TaxID=208602 RepID=UPI002E1B83D3